MSVIRSWLGVQVLHRSGIPLSIVTALLEHHPLKWLHSPAVPSSTQGMVHIQLKQQHIVILYRNPDRCQIA